MVGVWLDAEVNPKDPAVIKLQKLNDKSTEADLGDPSFWEPLLVANVDSIRDHQCSRFNHLMSKGPSSCV